MKNSSEMASTTIFDDNFDKKIDQFMEEGHIPSLAASITYKGEIYWTKVYGERNDPDSVFMIGSITKAVTATAILQLFEDGQIKDLNDDVNDYLPFEVRNPHIPNDPITIRGLLSHRSGLYDWETSSYVKIPFNQLLNESEIFKPLFTNQDFLPYPLWLKEYFETNGLYYNISNWMPEPVRFSYSNCGHMLLGHLIEIITNQSLENYFFTNIFEPLGMNSTHMYLENYTLDDLVEGNIWVKEEYYSDFGLKNENSPFPQYDSQSYGAGSLHSTAQDMSKFLLFQLTGEYKGKRLLSPESIKLMHSNQGNENGYFHEGEYGLGWMIDEQTLDLGTQEIKVKIQGHGGNSPYFWASIKNVNQILPNGSINNDPIGLTLLVNQGYNLRESD